MANHTPRGYVLLNVTASIGSQFAGIVISLLIPRLIIEHYGSEVNGLVSTVSRIAAYFAVVQGGVVAAAGAHLFAAFARDDREAVTAIFVAAHRFFLRSGSILVIFAVIISFLFPLDLWGGDFYWPAVAITAMSFVVIAAGYLIFFKYNLIVDSDQKSYVIINSIIVTNVLVAGVQAVLITQGASIVLVMMIPAVAGLIRMAVTRVWVQRSYPYLRLNGRADSDALGQKWDALAISTSRLLKFVLPSVVASIMLGFEYASVFLVYATIFNIGSSIVEMVSATLAATLGRVVASGESGRVRTHYEVMSLVGMGAAAGVSVCFSVLFQSFLQLYIPVADVSYWAPVLMCTFIANEFLTNIRLAPNLLVRATGHLRQTRSSATIELLAASFVTPLGVMWLGVDGLMLGSLVSSAYRTVFLEWYCRSRMGIGQVRLMVRRLGYMVVASAALTWLLGLWAITTGPVSWTTHAVITVVATGIVLVVTVALFERDLLGALVNFLRPRNGMPPDPESS